MMDPEVGRIDHVPVLTGSNDWVVGIVLSVVGEIHVFISGIVLIAAVVEVT